VDHKCEKCLSPSDCTIQCQAQVTPVLSQSLLYRLRKRAEIRRQIPGRLAVVEGKPDKIADLLEEAANEIERLKTIHLDH
jgi:GTP1/Obg family GTP-binding protein